ncbi:ABC transporter substrate-binding protein [Novosphingobium mangrovi (ex Hu et al. 2023)]|uniref:ABC transporter substrate-binding protein n=1 Tax=Novosphingobium mangrovi (ex Hu et al. 2023) TaxID=2930094 RepID=A0ABT0A939_9SPHN|nr:ABC transporter substrate-binding protein [Novosphingobium mangrovi (ex Hu et al. 2023)]MCJ1959723.1 ABC transporter substrate-binding protein [Novosphingobium mangrovi (ex Hu et al. 2023)]
MTDRIRIGVLNDAADLRADEDDDSPACHDIAFWLDREIAALRRRGCAVPEVEIVHAYALGLPGGTGAAVEDACHRLVDDGVALIVGPLVSDNAAIAARVYEDRRVPAVICSHDEHARTRHAFQLQSGGAVEEAVRLVEHLVASGCTRPVVLHETSRLGERLAKAFQEEAGIAGLAPSASIAVPTLAGADDVPDILAPALNQEGARPDALIYLGRTAPPRELRDAIGQSGYDGACLLNLLAARSAARPHAPARPEDLEGWLHLSLVTESNPRFRALQSEFPAAGAHHDTMARNHDLARLVAHALARAPSLTPSGLRLALEQVRLLPAAQGEDGTMLGFGPLVRAALQGAYLTIRRWQAGGSVALAET